MIVPVGSTAAAAPASTTSSAAAKTGDVSKGFEQLLVQQLAQEMLKTVDDASTSDDSGGASGLGGPYASLLPSALTDAIEQNGGLGLDLGLGTVGS
jgi:hypothetical protein